MIINNDMKRLFGVLALAMMSVAGFAQSDDFGTILSVEADKKINKKFSVGLEAEMRTRDDVKKVDRWSAGVQASYKVSSWLKASAGYTFLYDNNEKASYYDDDDEVYPIKHRMNLKEYFGLYGLESDVDQPRQMVQETTFSQHFFTLFSQNLLGQGDYQVMDILREKYRGWKYLIISEVENPHKEYMTPIPNLGKFLNYIGFVPERKGSLQGHEIDYLTGGWFEEYVYALIKNVLQPDDIAMGVHISNGIIKHNNELDVCFMKANKLFVIECKTGVASESYFNEIVYKVCALKEVLLGTSNSYIFSLKKDHKGSWKKTAKYMGITFCDWLNLTKPELMKNILKSMDKIAKEN